MTHSEVRPYSDFAFESYTQTFLRPPDDYYQRAGKALEYHTASPDTYLTIAEEQQLATLIQEGIQAESEDASDQDAISAGRRAFATLVECNLRFSALLARLSMDLLTDAERTALAAGDAPNLRRLLTGEEKWMPRDLRSLRSPYAVLDDRIQIAHMALVRAARNFLPGWKTEKGEPFSFLAYAAPFIKTDLTNFVAGRSGNHERLMYTSPKVTAKIFKALDDTAALDPEERERLLAYNRLHELVPFDDLYYAGAADEEGDWYTDPPLLPASEIIAPPEALDADVLVSNKLLHRKMQLALLTLGQNERYVIWYLFGLGGQTRTINQIATDLNISTRQVRQSERMALDRLFAMSKTGQFSDYLDYEFAAAPMRSGDIVKTRRTVGASVLQLMVVPNTAAP